MSTWVLIDDLKQSADKRNPLGETLATNWEYPLDIVFLKASGEYVTKLNSFRDLPNAHHDVGHAGHPSERSGPSNADIFLARADQFLKGQRAGVPLVTNPGSRAAGPQDFLRFGGRRAGFPAKQVPRQ